MRKLLFGIFLFAPVLALGQSAFDGTWRFNTQNAEVQAQDKQSLQNGMWRCDTCIPKIAVKADGKDHKVSGSPYFDTTNVSEVNDHTVEIVDKKADKVSGTAKMTASDDGKTLTTEWTFITPTGEKGSGKTESDRVGEAPAGANKVSGTWRPRKIENASENILTVTYKATGDGLSMSDPLGDSYTAKFDGKDYPYKGDPGITSVSLKKIDANTIEETDKRNGKVITVARITVSPDGKMLNVNVDDKLHAATAKWTAEKQ